MANMELGEILIHLLGGAGAEFAERSQFTQQAKEGAKETELARAQALLLQGRGFEQATGERLGSEAHELGITREGVKAAKTEAGSKRTHETSERIGVESHDARMKRLARESDKYQTKANNIARAAVANIGAEAEKYGIDRKTEFGYWSDTLNSEAVMAQLEVSIIGMGDKLPTETIRGVLDRQRSRYLNALQRSGATPKEANDIMIETRAAVDTVLDARELDFSSPTGEEKAEIEFKYWDDYQKNVGLGLRTKDELFKEMIINIYNEVEAKGLGRSAYAATLYDLTYGEDAGGIEAAIEEGTEATIRREEKRKVAEGPLVNRAMSPDGGGFVPQFMRGVLDLPIVGDLYNLRPGNVAGTEGAEIMLARVLGYSSTAIATAINIARDSDKSILDILRSEFDTPYVGMPYVGKHRGLPADTMQTGAPPGLE